MQISSLRKSDEGSGNSLPAFHFLFDVLEVPLGAESHGAETPTSLGMGLRHHRSEIGVWEGWNV